MSRESQIPAQRLLHATQTFSAYWGQVGDPGGCISSNLNIGRGRHPEEAVYST